MNNQKVKTDIIITLLISIFFFLFGSCNGPYSNHTLKSISSGVVYGEDDKQFIEEATISDYPIYGMIPIFFITDETPTTVSLRAQTMKKRFRLCSTNEMESSLSISNCTGFMISDMLLITSAHCVTNGVLKCDDIFWYRYSKQTVNRRDKITVNKNELISCKEILYPENLSYDGNNSPDLLLMRVEKQKNKNIINIDIDTKQNYEKSTPVYTIGHPAGIGLTLTEGKILKNRTDTFLTDLDTFMGSSGSPVFDKNSNEFIGMVSGGEDDFVLNEKKWCYEIQICKDGDNKCDGERILKKATILNEINSFLR